MTRKQKEIMLNALDSSWAISALFRDDLEEEEFMKVYGFTEEQAQDALEALIKMVEK